MKKLILSIAVLSLLSGQSSACDKCKNRQQVAYVVPSGTVTTSSVASVPMTYSSQMTYAAPMSVAPMTVAVPMTFATSSAQSLQFVPTQMSSVSAAPMYYTVPTTQSAFATQSFVPQSFVTPSTVYYTTDAQSTALASAQTQGLISDLLIGLARPAACEVCRNIGCGTNAGNSSSDDTVKNLRDLIKDLGDLIRAAKSSDSVSQTTPAVEAAPGSDDSQIAQLTRLRDEFRTLNQTLPVTRVAQEQK